MAHMIVQQQTRNINIHQTTLTKHEIFFPISRSFDDRIFLYQPDSKSLFPLFRRSASEPQVSKFQSASNGFLNLSHSFLPLDKSDEKIQQEIHNVICDQIEPATTEDVKSNQLDNVSKTTTPIVIDDLDQDNLLKTTSSLNPDYHSFRQKRRPSFRKIAPLSDEMQLIIRDSIEKLDKNNNQTINIKEEKQESKNIQIPSSNLLPGRNLRYRSYRQTTEIPAFDSAVQLSILTETPNSTQPSSPISPPATVSESCHSSNSPISSLKCTGSMGATKKMVRFADSVGRELEQVQYIPSLDDDDDDLKEFSYTKNNVYLPSTFDFEHKPWSFDVASSSKQVYNTPILKRFFCLYRQPNCEQPDIYLHEIWKSQIKLEHADIRLKYCSTTEQCLFGTAWVTNASYQKNVTIKYTFNRWLTIYEYEAQHRYYANDFRNINQFEFSIDIQHDADRIDFVLRYHVNEQEYWDNNDGNNYKLETESASIPQTIISLPHDCDFNEMRFY